MLKGWPQVGRENSVLMPLENSIQYMEGWEWKLDWVGTYIGQQSASHTTFAVSCPCISVIPAIVYPS